MARLIKTSKISKESALLSTLEAADYLTLGRKAFARLVDTGRIPFIQLGNKAWVFEKEDLDAYILKKKKGIKEKKRPPQRKNDPLLLNQQLPLVTRLLKTREAVKYLNISRTTLFDFIRNKKIPFILFSEKTIRFDLGDLDQFIQSAKTTNTQKINPNNKRQLDGHQLQGFRKKGPRPRSKNKAANLLRTGEIAKRMGVCRRTAYRFMNSGKVPVFKFGPKNNQITKKDLEKYMRSVKKKRGQAK